MKEEDCKRRESDDEKDFPSHISLNTELILQCAFHFPFQQRRRIVTILLASTNSYTMAKSLFLLTTLLAAQEANAFAPSAGSTRAIGGLGMAADAQALSDYMAKSHEEKLRAIKEVEDKKNTEIAVSFISA